MKSITINGTRFTICTFLPEGCRNRVAGLLIHDLSDEFGNGDGVVADCELPATEGDAECILQGEYIETDGSVLATVVAGDALSAHDFDPVDVISVITGSRKQAELAIRNGHDDLYTPEEWIALQREYYDEEAEGPIDFGKLLEDIRAGHYPDYGDCTHFGRVCGIPFVWMSV